jgi:DNA damage-binding protein 1
LFSTHLRFLFFVVFIFSHSKETCALHDRKKMSLGTRPVLLNTFESKNASHVFAVSDRPTVIYSSNKKLFYSTINLKEVDCICSFNTEAFPDSLAIASEGNLMIGTIDEIQKLHIRTVPLGEMPRRITYHESSQSFGVVVLHFGVNEAGADVESSYVRLLDDASFDIQDSYQFKDLETGCSIASVRFSSDPTEYIVVGTAVSRPDEAQPKEGRILVFSVLENKKLQLVCEKLINGAAFCLSEFSGKLLVGINNIVGLYSWDGSCNLVEESHCGGNILVTGLATQGNTIIVTDLLRSISVIHYNSVESKLQELARDYTSRWMTGAELLTDESFIGAENQYNLFTLTKNPEAESQEERSRLELAGQYHLGEIVNKIRHGKFL